MSDAIKRQLVSQSVSQSARSVSVRVAVGLFSENFVFLLLHFEKRRGKRGDKVCLARTDFAHVRRARRTTLLFTVKLNWRFLVFQQFLFFFEFLRKNSFVNDRLKVGI